jgi:hypothetical protein
VDDPRTSQDEVPGAVHAGDADMSYSEPAFPCGIQGNQDHPSEEPFFYGLTIRDYFANSAIQGLIAWDGTQGNPIGLAEYAYEIADAMLLARTPEGNPQ